jgi:flavin-dependent dehydrogenase
MNTEISIIGGNISGISSAIYLQEKNPDLNITIYEPKIWNKPCGGAISIEFYEYLKKEFQISLEEEHHAPELRTGLWSGRYVSTDSPFILTTRYDLQNKLVSLAKKKGINIIEKRVVFEDKDLFTPQTIVASGYSGLTRKLMDQNWKDSDFAPIIRFDGVVKKGASYPDASFIILDNKMVGYGWLFVGSNGHINLGLGGLGSPEVVNKRYYLFLDLLRDKYGVTIPADQVKPEGWGLPLPINKWKYKVANNIPEYPEVEFIGVGDALGLAHPILGAGIEPGWQSGWLLAESYNKTTGLIDPVRYKKLLRLNHKVSSGRRLDKFLANSMRNRMVPGKDNL